MARLAALRVGPRGRIVATDIAPPMLDIARAKPTLDGAAAIDYVESSAAPLGAPSGTFDAVLCQQGLQFFPDRSAALLFGRSWSAIRSSQHSMRPCARRCRVNLPISSRLRSAGQAAPR
ncbi:MAG: class I SAM-dependent methyltransferase [Alphaproteobacteria bacterium]|nr:MAG: class I SAM-dependent methyltransferase [Alphaproteobacteria bacterium]